MIKKGTFLLTGLVVLAASCTKVPAPAGEEKISRITATYVDGEGKTILAENGTSVLWSPSDEISVFYNTVGVKFISQNTSPVGQTIFTSEQSIIFAGTEGNPATYLYGIYPYNETNAQEGDCLTLTVPAEQTAVEGSFAKGSFPCIARSANTNMAFYNVCGGVRFSLCQKGIGKIKISGGNDEILAGKVKVCFGASGVPEVNAVVSGEKTITLVAPDGGEFQTGEWYYISVLPTVLSNGISIEFIKRADESKTARRTISKSLEIKRSVFGTMANLASAEGAVDLGLSVLWAKCNIGASKPEDYGGYYQWAGLTDVTSTSIELGWNNCPYHTGSERKTGWTKYNTNSSFGTVDNKTILDPEDDIAQENLGGFWRIPTIAEWTELMDNCTWTWTNNYNGTGIAGEIVTSNKTGYTDKSIFLPAGGWRNSIYLDYDGSYGCYWSANLCTDTISGAYDLYFNSTEVGKGNYHRLYGRSVRPVLE